MKRTISILALMMFLIPALWLGSATDANACTNFIVTKGASTDGSVMITYNADAGGFMEPFFYLPAMDHKEDSVDIYEWDTGKFLGRIKQVAHTYQVVGNMNEWQVSIGETTFGGRTQTVDTNARVDYGSLIYLALQRSKTAREAIITMGEIVKEYGYYSEGESFSVADANEAWILEMLSKGPWEKGAVWVARRVPDGYICAHANQARIREFPLDDPDNCIYSEDVIDFAVKHNYYDKKSGKPFSFVDAYCPPDFSGLLACEGRVWSMFRHAAPSQNFSPDYFQCVKGAEPYPLFVKPDKKLSVRDVISIMRDHFEGTEFDMTKGVPAGPYGNPYRWKPLTWKIDGDTVTNYIWERPISTQQTAFAFVSQMRSFLPREVGGVFWYGVDDNYSTVYIPLYCCMTRPPKPFVGGSIATPDLNSGFWVFNLVANLAYTKYSYIIKDIQEVQNELETKFAKYQSAIEKAAIELGKTDPKLMVEFLTDYSYNQSVATVDRWRELWYHLVAKYNDGYINDPKIDHGRHPKGVGYGNDFFRAVVKERPNYFQMQWKEKKK